MGILYTAIIGLVIGWIWTTYIQKQSSNLLKNLILGVAGAILGGILFGFLGGGIILDILGGLVGVAIILWVVDKFF